MWILRASEASGSLTFRLANGTARTVGRAAAADFILDVALVSRVHCRLVASDEALAIEDLASTNGTFLNNQRIEKGRATGGDRLRLGRVELTVEKAVS
ncbi:MAG: FHA domain-containing protein [Acidobacteriota bacterium]